MEVLGLLITVGVGLVLSAIYPATRPFPYLTGRGRALRLKRLSDKLAIHLETSTESTEKCYQMLRVLVGTTFAQDKAMMGVINRDSAWRRARRKVLFNAARGHSVAKAFLRKEPEPGALLARQCFRSIRETCLDCPMLKLHPKNLPARCPSMDAFQKE